MLLKLKNRDNETIVKVRDTLLSMKGKIQYLQDIKVYTDVRHGATSYDIAVVAQYSSMKDFEAYLVHPVHVEVGKYIKSVLDSSTSVCYES
jgi:hypothetical protein